MARLLGLGPSGCKFESYHLEYLLYYLFNSLLLYIMEDLNIDLNNPWKETFNLTNKEIEEYCIKHLNKQENIKCLQPIKEEKLVWLQKVSASISRERELILDIEKLVYWIRDRLWLGNIIAEQCAKDVDDDRRTLDIFADMLDNNRELLVKINDLLVDIDYRI